ncbi:thiamine ABC transporter substrate-binding protein [Georgenia sp. Z1491]|uniref:thiamine ABC transporter substrate-binding protein n=1 Tax=Georgenia sp. Z1491 TaxID=3416707 RepID=UPI003CF82C78
MRSTITGPGTGFRRPGAGTDHPGPHRRGARALGLGTALALTLAGCSLGGGDEDTDDSESAGDAETAEQASEGASGGSGEAPAGAGGEVALVTHDSFNLPDELIEQFEAESGYTLVVTAPGDAGSVVNELLLTAGSPSADVVYGIDNAYASRAIDGGVLEPYTSPDLPASAEDLLVDGGDQLTPVDFGDVCLNVDTAWFEREGLTPPQTLADLTEPDYADLTVVTDPNVSSPGLSLLVATVAESGEEGFADYWQSLLDNGLRVVDSWSDAYYVDFTFSGGDRPIVLSYSSSPAATPTEDGTGSTTAALLDTCVRQVEYAGVVADANNPEGARAVIDWLLSADVQAAMPDSMYMYPVDDEAPLPEAWSEFAPPAEEPIEMPAGEIDANREEWLRTWDEVVGG